jgi:hypothetical protein
MGSRVCGGSGITCIILSSNTNSDIAGRVCGRNELCLITRHLESCAGQVTAGTNMPRGRQCISIRSKDDKCEDARHQHVGK